MSSTNYRVLNGKDLRWARTALAPTRLANDAGASSASALRQVVRSSATCIGCAYSHSFVQVGTGQRKRPHTTSTRPLSLLEGHLASGSW